MFFRYLFVFILIIAPTEAFTQSAFLNSGESGVSFSGGFGVNEDATTVAGGFGFSAATVIDIGMGFGYAAFDGDLSAFYIAPGFEVFVLKQGRNEIPINLSFGASYEHDFYSANSLDYLGLDMGGDFGSIDMGISGGIQSSPNFALQPYARFGFTFGQIKLSDSFGNYVKESDETVFGSAGLAFVFVTAPTSKVVLSAGGSVNEDVFSFNMGFGLVLVTAQSQ